MKALTWCAVAVLVAVGVARLAGAQSDGEALIFESTEITEIVRLEQSRSTSDPLAQPETTVDQETLAIFAEQIFVGSVWTLNPDGSAAFEFGREYDLEDFGISEDQSVITGTWAEKRNGELAVEIAFNDESPDLSKIIILGLTADITLGDEGATASAHFYQLVMFANATQAVGDEYTYDVMLELVPPGEAEGAESGEAGEGSEPPDETPELLSVSDAEAAEEIANDVIAGVEEGFAAGEFGDVLNALYEASADEAFDNVELFVVTLEWYGRLFPDATLDCEPAVAGSHGGVVASCEFDGVADDDAVEDLLDMTRRDGTDDDAEVTIDVTIFFLIADGSVQQAQFVPDYLGMLEQLEEYYESA